MVKYKKHPNDTRISKTYCIADVTPNPKRVQRKVYAVYKINVKNKAYIKQFFLYGILSLNLWITH